MPGYAGAVPTISNCLGCPYRYGVAIGPRGNPFSRIVLVGEAPGATEIVEGEPFRGRAGDVLKQALAAADLRERDIFITNAVACRPPHGPPSAEAIRACHGRLVHDIEAHPRAVIVALGRTAVRAVAGRRDFPMLKQHGEPLPTIWGPVVPTLHPARVLRRPAEYPLLVGDLKHARRVAYGPGV
jgi:uracil-DNA glycosylase family 4